MKPLFAFGAALLWLGAHSTLSAETRKDKAKKSKVVKASSPKKVKASAKQKVSAAPPPPPLNNLLLETSVVNEIASVWRGCLEAHDVPKLAWGLGMAQARLEPVLSKLGLLSGDNSPCAPYVAATGGAGGAASALFLRPEPKAGEASIIDLRKSADGITITPGACDCAESIRRVVEFSAGDLAPQRLDEILASVPTNIRWQLDTLLPKMIARLPDEPHTLTVRVAFDRKGADKPEYLQAIEILDVATGRQVDGAWWLNRPDGPGVLIGKEGVALERLFWQSPLNYRYKSRGLGPAVTSYRRVATAPKKGGKAVMRTFAVRGYHLGSDLLAPQGTDVHAVADAKVVFAGRRGDYGNLIILDHGLGYQTYYAHLSVIKPLVIAGATISRGDLIGLVGSTGRSTAPHLHFEARKDAKFIDPFDNSRQWEFWLLSPDDQERLAMEMLTQGRLGLAEDAVATDALKNVTR